MTKRVLNAALISLCCAGAIAPPAHAEGCGVAWESLPVSGPSGRDFGAMAYDGVHHQIVLFGGFDGSIRGDTWLWNGATWSLAAITGPAPRSAHCMAFDSARGNVVLFGGASSNGTLLGDTWAWDGAAWTQVSAGGPSPRAASSLAYDSLRSRIVLFGGTIGGAADFVRGGDTWEWDGAAWTLASTSGPGSRSEHSMAFDATSGVVVMFGGNSGAGGNYVEFNDTWEWDGATWTPEAPYGAFGRTSFALAHDWVRGVTIMFGGNTLSNGRYSDTSVWNGAAWTDAEVVGPDARYGHAMAYDSDRSVTVLFGGYNGTMLQNDTWELTIGGPPIIALQPVDTNIIAGQQAAFSVASIGAPESTVQWRKDGIDLIESGEYSGTTSPNLAINPAGALNAGVYDAIVTNECGSLTSAAGALSISQPCPADFTGDGSVGAQDLAFLLGAWGPGGGPTDLNGDGSVGAADLAQVLGAWGPCP